MSAVLPQQGQSVFANPARLDDGRQSERAAHIQRGIRRYLRAIGFASVTEFTFKTGRRADVIAFGPEGAIWIIEIKSSLADLHADQKWPEYQQWCDRFYFATLPDVDAAAFPETEGLFIADGYGATCLREAEDHKLSAARRKSLLLAIAHSAANRLHQACDPELGEGAVF